MGQHFDEDGDGVADRADRDPQTRAFTGATDLDWTSQLPAGAVVHYPGEPDALPIGTPEAWDAAGWDADRDGPKTPEEAAAALAERIAAPDAPDAPEVAGAYDGEVRG